MDDGSALADELVNGPASPDMPLKQIHLARELPTLGRGPHPHQQLVAKERFLHEIDGAKLHRFHRRVDGAEARHDDEARIHAVLAEFSQDVEPGNARHPHVGEDHIESPAASERESSSPLGAVCTVYPAERSMRSMLSRTALSSSITRMRDIRGQVRVPGTGYRSVPGTGYNVQHRAR